ncbi:DUF6367 family protein [Vibrio parahaemolyticus]|uniref:DUF6367 family protein n=1 Tax=Vibrio parahaemolyticus TaxID=670 RepID=UPI00186992B5|nr:hypothetical protein [Vibrio parahaemolyticus]
MKSFSDFLEEQELQNGIDYFILEVNDQALIYKLEQLNEGRWNSSGKKDWMYRVDAANPSQKQQRHVHIARSKHTNSKNMQASWNQDGSKHDKKTFNSNIAQLNVVQSIAKDVLGLNSTVKLEESTASQKILTALQQINESSINEHPVFRLVKA